MTDTATRHAHLTQMLCERRCVIEGEVRGRMRDGRTDRQSAVGDALDRSDAGIQGDIDLALLQIRTDTLTRIDVALRRLEDGKYASCVECERDIAERRLRALPFAVRCQACEERRENESGHVRRLAERRGGPLLFEEGIGL
jgi:DnaK suppressor protein